MNASEILGGLGIEARFTGEGCDRMLADALPTDLARQAVRALSEAGIGASDAPDNDDRSVAWLYITDSE